jgi:hypothetical protein
MFWQFLLKRLQEPSTWASIGGAVAAATVPGIPVAAQVAIAATTALGVLNPEAPHVAQ